MSANNEDLEGASNIMMYCAACGIGGAGDIKLKNCTACNLVRYCSVKCQKEHRPKHKKECKKRAAELRDEILFKQPESRDLGDCPICCIPLPINALGSTLMACCCKMVCNGCNIANQMREVQDSLENKCPFCRHPAPYNEKETKINLMRRIEVNDPVAMRQMGQFCYDEGDYSGAFEYFSKAAELGNAVAHYLLSVMYHEEKVKMDEKKKMYHSEQAAMGGNPFARKNLANIEWKRGRKLRAVKHGIIGAKLGDDDALKSLKLAYGMGLVSKEDFAAALRGHQTAVNATKSPAREAAEAYYQMKMKKKEETAELR
jgi:TPR repeat protein